MFSLIERRIQFEPHYMTSILDQPNFDQPFLEFLDQNDSLCCKLFWIKLNWTAKSQKTIITNM